MDGASPAADAVGSARAITPASHQRDRRDHSHESGTRTARRRCTPARNRPRRLFEPGIRPGGWSPRAPACPCRAAPLPAHGAEAATVVNNNAAATLLVLAALAAGREVIVSRGELVEIGGGFRVPDVMAQSGAALREVGTTNRTRTADYAAAIGERTALILRVHPSNFRVEGFTERPALAELVGLAHRFQLPLFEDLGSGWLGGTGFGEAVLRDEPPVAGSLAAGADLVAFSGDKLLGGPQSGLIVGRANLVGRVRRHPLMRALRVDKLTYATLEATLALWAREPARPQIPVYRMLTLTVEDLDVRARRLAARLGSLPHLRVEVIDGVSTIGGGSAPGSALPTRLVAIERSRSVRLSARDPSACRGSASHRADSPGPCGAGCSDHDGRRGRGGRRCRAAVLHGGSHHSYGKSLDVTWQVAPARSRARDNTTSSKMLSGIRRSMQLSRRPGRSTVRAERPGRTRERLR